LNLVVVVCPLYSPRKSDASPRPEPLYTAREHPLGIAHPRHIPPPPLPSLSAFPLSRGRNLASRPKYDIEKQAARMRVKARLGVGVTVGGNPRGPDAEPSKKRRGHGCVGDLVVQCGVRGKGGVGGVVRRDHCEMRTTTHSLPRGRERQ
jgi:hypothetical protein